MKLSTNTKIIIGLATVSIFLAGAYLVLPPKYKTKVKEFPKKAKDKVKEFFSVKRINK